MRSDVKRALSSRAGRRSQISLAPTQDGHRTLHDGASDLVLSGELDLGTASPNGSAAAC
jgi:hypothetical protein